MRFKRLGHVLGITLAGVVFLSGGVVITMLQEGGGGGGGGGQQEIEPAVPTPLRPVALTLICGLTPEALAVAGCTASDAEAIIAACASLGEAADEAWSRIAQAEAASKAYRDLESELRRYGGTPAQREQLAGLKSVAQQASAGEVTAIGACRDSLLASLAQRVGASNAGFAARYIANIDRRIPTEWRVLDLSPGQFAALESALAHQGDEAYTPAPEESAVLLTVSISADAAVAAQRLEALTPALKQAMNAATAVAQTE